MLYFAVEVVLASQNQAVVTWSISMVPTPKTEITFDASDVSNNSLWEPILDCSEIWGFGTIKTGPLPGPP